MRSWWEPRKTLNSTRNSSKTRNRTGWPSLTVIIRYPCWISSNLTRNTPPKTKKELSGKHNFLYPNFEGLFVRILIGILVRIIIGILEIIIRLLVINIGLLDRIIGLLVIHRCLLNDHKMFDLSTHIQWYLFNSVKS